MAKAIRFLRQSQSEFYKLFSPLCGTHSAWEVWADFVSMSAVSIANVFDRQGPVHDDRERQYMETIRRYPKEEQKVFPRLLATMVMALEEDPEQDFLGEMFSALELNSHWKGQFFTPYNIGHLLAEATVDGVEERVERQGWVSVNDPCCGAGALLVAARNVMVRRNIPSTAVLFVAQDLDRTAALMCYLQLALLGCAGYVVVADTMQHPLTGDPLYPGASTEQEVWYLPMFYHRVWQQRILWRRMDAILSGGSRAQPQTVAVESTADTLPPPSPPEPATPPLILELSATSTGQLTLF